MPKGNTPTELKMACYMVLMHALISTGFTVEDARSRALKAAEGMVDDLESFADED